jgi:hypothetical protein
MLARAQRWLEGPRPSRIMVNYQTMLNGRDSRWRDYDLFIDPGAYSMFAPPENGGQGLAEYPESTESYLYDIGQMQPARYAWRDYVCEDDVREFHDWTVEEQSLAMGYVNNDDMEPLEAGKKVIRENPQMLERWFNRSGIYQTGGIKTADGKNNPADAVSKALGL